MAREERRRRRRRRRCDRRGGYRRPGHRRRGAGGRWRRQRRVRGRLPRRCRVTLRLASSFDRSAAAGVTRRRFRFQLQHMEDSMSAHTIFEHAPFGAIVAWSDATQRNAHCWIRGHADPACLRQALREAEQERCCRCSGICEAAQRPNIRPQLIYRRPPDGMWLGGTQRPVACSDAGRAAGIRDGFSAWMPPSHVPHDV